MSEHQPAPVSPENSQNPASKGRMPFACIALGIALAGVAFSYWSTLLVLAERWTVDPLYSHGFLVPVVSGVLIWMRRDLLQPATFRTLRGKTKTITNHPQWVAGLGLVSFAVALRLSGAWYYYEWFDWLSFVPCAAGLCLLIGGVAAWRAAWPAILFLSFMVPLPYRAEMALGGPLQAVATQASTFALQTLGYPAVAEGNLIVIDETHIGVAEACSGLRMLMVFFAVTSAVGICLKKPAWEKLLVVASAIPIALICNVVRITATGVLFESVGSAWAKMVLHDYAGWLMMLMAIGLLKLELWMLSHILIEPPAREVVPVMTGRVVESLHSANTQTVSAGMPEINSGATSDLGSQPDDWDRVAEATREAAELAKTATSSRAAEHDSTFIAQTTQG